MKILKTLLLVAVITFGIAGCSDDQSINALPQIEKDETVVTDQFEFTVENVTATYDIKEEKYKLYVKGVYKNLETTAVDVFNTVKMNIIYGDYIFDTNMGYSGENDAAVSKIQPLINTNIFMYQQIPDEFIMDDLNDVNVIIVIKGDEYQYVSSIKNEAGYYNQVKDYMIPFFNHLKSFEDIVNRMNYALTQQAQLEVFANLHELALRTKDEVKMLSDEINQIEINDSCKEEHSILVKTMSDYSYFLELMANEDEELELIFTALEILVEDFDMIESNSFFIEMSSLI